MLKQSLADETTQLNVPYQTLNTTTTSKTIEDPWLATPVWIIYYILRIKSVTFHIYVLGLSANFICIFFDDHKFKTAIKHALWQMYAIITLLKFLSNCRYYSIFSTAQLMQFCAPYHERMKCTTPEGKIVLCNMPNRPQDHGEKCSEDFRSSAVFCTRCCIHPTPHKSISPHCDIAWAGMDA